jgi:hypothetical protein
MTNEWRMTDARGRAAFTLLTFPVLRLASVSREPEGSAWCLVRSAECGVRSAECGAFCAHLWAVANPAVVW